MERFTENSQEIPFTHFQDPTGFLKDPMNILRIAFESARGISHLHNCGVTHCDLSAR